MCDGEAHGPLLNTIAPLHKLAKRDYVRRVMNEKVHRTIKAKE